MGELIQIDYNHQTTYSNTANNAIGATTSTTLRTIPTPAGNIAYVRKFGAEISATACTAIDEPTANGTITVKSKTTNTTLGSRANGGLFVAGATLSTAEGIYLVLSASGGTFTTAATESITLTGAGAITVCFDQEPITTGNSRTLYLATSGSTYYDTLMKYGGARHTPALDSQILTYFHPYDAYAALNSTTDGVCILDSEHYSFPYYDGTAWRNELSMSRATTYLYSANGQSPTIEGIVGASIYREVTIVHNNVNSIFVSKTGNDANAGTYQLPKLTHANAFASLAAQTYIVTMDSESYNEDIDINAAINFESLYGKTPIFTYNSAITHILNITAAASIYGLTFDGKSNINYAIYNYNYNATGYFKNNTIYNFTGTGNNSAGIYYTNAPAGGFSFSGFIEYNKIYNCTGTNCGGIFLKSQDAALTGQIRYNILNNNSNAIFFFPPGLANVSNTTAINNNVCYNNYAGINIVDSTLDKYNGNIQNNTCFNNSYGISLTRDGINYTGTASNNITWGNTTRDLNFTVVGGETGTITNSHYDTNTGWTLGAGMQDRNPLFCNSITQPYKLGIQPDITATVKAYRNGADSDDRGAHFRLIEINEDNITISGIIFNGNSQYNNAIYILDTADHTGHSISWCTFENFQGLAIDLYDNDVAIAATIQNCKIDNNGSGIAVLTGSNIIKNNLIYRNSVYGLFSDYTANTINNNTFYLNQYNTYFESNSSGNIYKNNISHGASLYGIFSETALIINYSCITDTINTLVDKTATSNIINDPLFIDVTSGSENFNIKTIEEGYFIESLCKETGDDGKDMGAHDISRTITQDYWEKYTLAFNPRYMNEGLKGKGIIEWYDNFGNAGSYGNAHKIHLPLSWESNSATSNTQMQKLKYFNTLFPTRQNGKTSSECEFRIHLLPDSYFGTGTGVIDSTAKTMTDSLNTFVENEKKGWFVTLKWLSGTLTGMINATNKTLTVSPSLSWTTNQWAGYYFHYNGIYYYIISNTGNVLTLSDVKGYLVSASNISWYICKYFKIEKNDNSGIFTLTDDDNELVSGSYSYFIDFILCRVNPSDFSWKQPVFDYEKDEWKSGYGITFEEVD